MGDFAKHTVTETQGMNQFSYIQRLAYGNRDQHLTGAWIAQIGKTWHFLMVI